MSVRELIIDGIRIPAWSSTRVSQDYEIDEAAFTKRTADGGLSKRTLYTGKRKTTISGGGLAPSGLHDLDTGSSFDISCIKPCSISGASNVFTLPANRRSDPGSEPYGFASVGDQLVLTPVAMATNTATLTTVAGATGYHVRWFPVLTVLAQPVKEEFDRGSGFRWSLVAEEV